MADITITASSVAKGANAVIENKFAGATITAGQSLYLDAEDGLVKLFDANSATVAARSLYGIALNGGATGQPIAVQRGGTITIGGTAPSGVVFVGSAANPGGICPSLDLTTGHYTNIVGIGQGNSQIKLGLLDGGVSA